MTDPFLQAAIEEARQGLREGGIPIGSVLVHGGKIIGRGHNLCFCMYSETVANICLATRKYVAINYELGVF